MKEQVNKYEEDRIGSGITSKLVGGAANIMTLGNSGWGIGRQTGENSYNKQTYDSIVSDPYSYKSVTDEEMKNVTLPEFEPIVKDYNTGKFVDGQIGSLNNHSNATGDQKVGQHIVKD
jgi:hypothetical protein